MTFGTDVQSLEDDDLLAIKGHEVLTGVNREATSSGWGKIGRYHEQETSSHRMSVRYPKTWGASISLIRLWQGTTAAPSAHCPTTKGIRGKTSKNGGPGLMSQQPGA